ncbi:CAP domain-containing protein, partial [Streptomyces nigra]|uniref:CAP domain-containing protein n=1 Tax=Streptomyces nigra TaxID=1827580 RepID=UPI00364FBC85
ACVAGGGLWYFDSVPGTGRQEPAAARGAGAAVPDELVEPSPVSTSASPSASASTSPKPSAKPSKKTTPSPSAKKTEKATPTSQAPTRASRKAASAPQQEAPSGTVGQVVALVNKERATAGCGPLAEDSLLDKSAQAHSADMAARDFFDHTNPDGADPGQRITAAGYRWSTYGENIAMGQQTPEAVMESWMNSPGHRANILNCSFKDIGVGVHEGPGGPWWTQNFGAKL